MITLPPRPASNPAVVLVGRIRKHVSVAPGARDSRNELPDSLVKLALRAYGITGVMLPRFWVPADRRGRRWKRNALFGAGAVALVVVSAACLKVQSAAHPVGQTMSAAASTTTLPEGTEAHNNADVWFVRKMIPHHQQAIEMSDILLAKQGIDPRVAELANKIKAAEVPESQQM